ncbi:uncharacterized protein LOC131845922 isoform X3 [Achroia grisella]|uniref:uncharacterized protein LOC131845922 isoform X3 n=1 Tax=Achroia grisella TaxID=688607 RepID=UPI0027D33227|nr:uncharacterized protein LOC131845922 isoform X3 [Achroia grisella]
MAYCYSDDCGEFAVTPMLVAPCYPSKCYEETVSYPCLPQCPKGRLVYCCEKDLPRTPPRSPISRLKERVDQCNDPHCRLHHGCNSPPRYRNRSPPPTRSPPCTPQDCCPTCCQPTCKPVKTKYVIPCYRYEDGRIRNQPTVLMRRACEVAIGTKAKRKPFVESMYCADSHNEVHRYRSEDERISTTDFLY